MRLSGANSLLLASLVMTGAASPVVAEPDEVAIAPRRRQQRATGGVAMAPVGRNHPDYGLSLAEHLERKAARAKEENA
jgi:hypothetical protein